MPRTPHSTAVWTATATFSIALLVGTIAFATRPDSPQAAPKEKKPIEVNIKKLTFIPDPVTIKVGDTIKWTNNDDRDYLLMAKDQSWKSENLRPKESFEHKFTEAGQIDYLDMNHPRMEGTIVVQEK